RGRGQGAGEAAGTGEAAGGPGGCRPGRQEPAIPPSLPQSRTPVALDPASSEFRQPDGRYKIAGTC
ncbi:MAG TPA: hypothetical protein VFQ68_10405, partial [Streptosporangiaceae bacterium]|nr:hypothetical protein [Streptosporangiaceae bacterium]